MVEETTTFKVHEHVLVPKHEKLDAAETEKLLEHYNIELAALPIISPNDPAIQGLKAKMGDVIKITRKSYTAGSSIYYRRVSEIIGTDEQSEEGLELLRSIKPKRKVAKKKAATKTATTKKTATKSKSKVAKK